MQINSMQKVKNSLHIYWDFATVCNMHSAKEYVDYKTMIKGQELLKELFEAYNK